MKRRRVAVLTIALSLCLSVLPTPAVAHPSVNVVQGAMHLEGHKRGLMTQGGGQWRMEGLVGPGAEPGWMDLRGTWGPNELGMGASCMGSSGQGTGTISGHEILDFSWRVGAGPTIVATGRHTAPDYPLLALLALPSHGWCLIHDEYLGVTGVVALL